LDLTSGIDMAAEIVIAISIIRGFIMYNKTITKTPAGADKRGGIHEAYVGNGLIRVLDLKVGSDIIRTY
jgi:hypothetical protein